MAYDEELAERIRVLLVDEPAMNEKKMFGGLGFMLDGNMAFGASSMGGLMVRIDPEDSDELVARPGAGFFEMKGRTMGGWLHIAGEDLAEDEILSDWLSIGIDFAASLPPK